MCEAATLTALSIGATVLSTGVGMVSQYMAGQQQAKSAKAAAEYNAQVAANEAATQKQLAQNEIAKGIADRERQQRQAARAMGEMRANMAASGFELDSGSNLSLLTESAQEHQYDSQVIMNNAAQAAWQHMVGVTAAENQGSFANWQKANAGSGKTAAMIGMGGTLLGGIGAGLGQYGQWQQVKRTEQPNAWKDLPKMMNWYENPAY